MGKIFITSLLLLSCLSLFAEKRQDDILSRIGIDQRLNEMLPLDAMLYDEEAQPVKLSRYFGEKPVILTLVYYECPMLCTQVLSGLVTCLRALPFKVGKEFSILTVSFDPGEKSSLALEKKKNYLQELHQAGAQEGWHFLTADQPSIDAITQAVGFRYDYDAKTDQFAHASAIMVITPNGKISKYFYGIEYAPRDLKFAILEASNNKIGSFQDRVLLYCYHYDPVTGKYGLSIMNLIRVAGGMTVVAIGLFIITMLRRDRKL
ncbi:MAG: SCO family protein [Chlamydiota bacterium]|nr:SCO family protein [Chlamydiota bacterium]